MSISLVDHAILVKDIRFCQIFPSQGRQLYRLDELFPVIIHDITMVISQKQSPQCFSYIPPNIIEKRTIAAQRACEHSPGTT